MNAASENYSRHDSIVSADEAAIRKVLDHEAHVVAHGQFPDRQWQYVDKNERLAGVRASFGGYDGTKVKLHLGHWACKRIQHTDLCQADQAYLTSIGAEFTAAAAVPRKPISKHLEGDGHGPLM